MAQRKPTYTNPLGSLINEYLKQKKNYSREQLAKDIGWDASTIGKIIRGDRVPKFKAPIITKISEKLNIPPDEIKIAHEKAIEEKERKDGSKKTNSSKKESIQEIAEPLTDITFIDDIYISVDKDFNKEACQAIKNKKKLIEAKIILLEQLLEDKNNDVGTIYITFMGKESIFDDHSSLLPKYQNTLAKVIQAGWKVNYIIRLDRIDRRRTYELVSNSFRFFDGFGKYQPKYLDTRSFLRPPYGIFLISKRSALISLSANESDCCDSSIFIRDSESIEILEKHCEQIEKFSKPIFERLKSYEQDEFIEILNEADKIPSDRFIISQRLSEITRPIEWYQDDHPWAQSLIKYLKNTDIKETDWSQHIKHRRRRAENLIKYNKTIGKNGYQCHYIYPKKIINDFIDTGYYNSSKYIEYYFKANEKQRIEQIETILKLLDYQGYTMAIVEDLNNEIFTKIKPSFCEVQGDHLVFMEAWHKNENGKKYSQWYLSKDPIVVRAFKEELSKLWSQLNAEEKDRYYHHKFFTGAKNKLLANLNNDS